LRDLLKTAEAIVEEDKKREFAAAEVVRLAAELKAKQEAEAKAKAAADLKAEQEAEARVAADKLAADKLAASKLVSIKKTTITCIKGKVTKKVTAVKPVCPKGYKVKK
jgi:hypothetical protein